MRIGVVGNCTTGEGYQPGVPAAPFNDAVAKLGDLSADIREVDCPHLDHSLSAYYPILPSEVSSNFRRHGAVGDDGSQARRGEVMRLTLRVRSGSHMIGTYALSAGYQTPTTTGRAQRAIADRQRSRQGLARASTSDLAG